jgi:hypothetical protein
MWQRRRLERLEQAGWECQNCGDKSTTLHVHHKQYIKGRMAWEYDDLELAVLCEPCHESEHADQSVLKQLLAQADTGEALGLLCGFHQGEDWFDRAILETGRQTEPLAYAAVFVAYLVYTLGDIDKMKAAAAFAASLHSPGTEARMVFEHGRGNTFGEGN